jgi:1-acyl-sn-glycerol-3-phosphate acyltransferase
VAEIVYPPVIRAALTAFKLLGLKIDIVGAENIPDEGGAVLASTHVSYIDFIFVGLGAHPKRRLVRFMAKKQVFDHGIGGPLMRGMHHIPVDRKAGAAAYDEALRALKEGELIGVFPEATINRAFDVKELKTGAARLAMESGVPLIPISVWGTQRMWTKGRPRRLTERGIPITIAVDKPVHIEDTDDVQTVTDRLAERLRALLTRIQDTYPEKPADTKRPDEDWWLPARLGGSAPTPEQAREMDAADYHKR